MRDTVLPLLRRSWPARLLLVLALASLVTAFALPEQPSSMVERSLTLPPAAESTDEPMQVGPEDGTEPTQAEPVWQTYRIRPGDSLSTLFTRWGSGYGAVLRLLQQVPEATALERLQAGDQLQYRLDDDHQLAALQLDVAEDRRLVLERIGEQWRGQQIDIPLRTTVHEARGEIDQSLFLAGQAAGLSDNLIMQLADIFGWDVDFVLDIRKGDRFALIYQKTWKEGRVIREGPILAAEFINRGRVLRAARYQRDDGSISYFTPEGRNMRKAFLRTPVDFTRISSRFSLKRKHPILKGVTRPHRGVDYAAPRGTPVKATGDGRVVKRARSRGYGKHIILQHGGKYQTLYAHLNAFRKDLRNGSRVRQGEIIGYVGMTGLATAPHLHYEFRINGVHRNPLKVRFPQADPLPAAELGPFLQQAAPLLARLQNISGSNQNVASAP